MPTRDLVLNTLLPLMREVGERWERGQMGIAQEHLVSAAMRNILGSLLRIQTAPTSAPRMLLSSLAGDPHEFGILAAAMIAVTAGWQPVYLGANLPAEEIANGARQTGAKVIVIGNSGRREVGPAVRHLSGLLPPDVAIWVGGSVESPETENASSDLPASIVLIPDMHTFEILCRDRV